MATATPGTAHSPGVPGTPTPGSRRARLCSPRPGHQAWPQREGARQRQPGPLQGRVLPRPLRGQQLQRPGFGADVQSAESTRDGHPQGPGLDGTAVPQLGRQHAAAGRRGLRACACGSGGLTQRRPADCWLLTFGLSPPHRPPACPRTAGSQRSRTLTLNAPQLTLDTVFPTRPWTAAALCTVPHSASLGVRRACQAETHALKLSKGDMPRSGLGAQGRAQALGSPRGPAQPAAR